MPLSRLCSTFQWGFLPGCPCTRVGAASGGCWVLLYNYNFLFSREALQITDGSVPYDFIAGIRPIATDCCILLFAHESRDSHFDSLVRVPVAAPPEAEPGDDLEKDTQKDIEGLRQLISAARECGGGVRLHPELSETAVADFVRKRQQEDDISCEVCGGSRLRV